MKYRKPNRLKYYDYSNAGWYFVTICTQNHLHHFGEILDKEMVLNDVGSITNKIWNEIPDHYPTVELDEFIIMPNHIHGIIINNSDVGERHASPLLGNIIGSFKSAVTKSVHLYDNNNFKWQRSFYDRIIRNEKELYNIRKYIQQNPHKWDIENSTNNLDF